jgi:hypothetical protein
MEQAWPRAHANNSLDAHEVKEVVRVQLEQRAHEGDDVNLQGKTGAVRRHPRKQPHDAFSSSHTVRPRPRPSTALWSTVCYREAPTTREEGGEGGGRRRRSTYLQGAAIHAVLERGGSRRATAAQTRRTRWSRAPRTK